MVTNDSLANHYQLSSRGGSRQEISTTLQHHRSYSHHTNLRGWAQMAGGELYHLARPHVSCCVRP